ncbi:hypothetical protein BDR26DRAFT_1006098, partial [Obelidium mucronatum]
MTILERLPLLQLPTFLPQGRSTTVDKRFKKKTSLAKKRAENKDSKQRKDLPQFPSETPFQTRSHPRNHHIPSRSTAINISHLSSKLILEILVYATESWNSVPCFRMVCRKFNRAFTSNPHLVDALIWRTLVQQYVDLSEEMPTIRNSNESWEDVLRLWLSWERVSMRTLVRVAAPQGMKAAAREPECTQQLTLKSVASSADSTLYASSSGTLSPAFVGFAEVVTALPIGSVILSAVLGPCQLLGNSFYYIQEASSSIGVGKSQTHTTLQALDTTTGIKQILSEFKQTEVSLSTSLLLEPSLVLGLRDKTRSKHIVAKNRFAIYKKNSASLQEINSEYLMEMNEESRIFHFKDVVMLVSNTEDTETDGRPVIDARRFDMRLESTPAISKKNESASLQIFRIQQNVGTATTLLHEKFSSEKSVNNPCCNEYLFATTEHINPIAVGTNSTKTSAKPQPTIREKLMHALKSERVTTIRIKKLPSSPVPTKSVTPSRFRTSSAEFSITDYHGDAYINSSNKSITASETSTSDTQSVLIDLTPRGLHIHGISMTRWHLIAVSTKFQVLPKPDAGTMESPEFLVKVVLSIYSLKTIDLVSEIVLNELTYTQRNRLFGKVRVCHAVCSSGRKVWVWLEGVLPTSLNGVGGMCNPLMKKRHSENGAEDVNVRPEMVVLDILGGGLRVYERRVAAKTETNTGGKIPWIKWRRGLESNGAAGKGAWVFYKENERDHEEKC